MDVILPTLETLAAGTVTVAAYGLYRTVRESRQAVSSWHEELLQKTGEREVPLPRGADTCPSHPGVRNA